MQGITIVGPGRLGGALAIALSRAGYLIDALLYRRRAGVSAIARKIVPYPATEKLDKADIDSPVVLITTQDQDIAAAAEVLLSKLKRGTSVFHTSGSLSSDVLEPLRFAGCDIASMHPLASISSAVEGADLLKDVFFCVEGDLSAVRTGKKMIKSIGGHTFTLDASKKALYHAAAVTAAGHVTTLFDVAVSLMSNTGLSRNKSRQILLPLLRTVTENLARHDTAKALTGTFARGDDAALARHIGSLEDPVREADLEIYLDLAIRSLELAERRGVEHSAIIKMRDRIMMAKRKLR